jgi:hypothetical protein
MSDEYDPLRRALLEGTVARGRGCPDCQTGLVLCGRLFRTSDQIHAVKSNRNRHNAIELIEAPI